jgi:polysaccharide export outer membrane protein
MRSCCLIIFLAAALAVLLNGPARALEPDYVLGPEDSISIVVLRHPDLNVSGVIPPDGKIVMPIAGEIMAAGKTRLQLAKEIAEKLRPGVADPEVSVVLVTPRIRRVYVVGAVAAPTVSVGTSTTGSPTSTASVGVLDLKPGWRVTELLAAAGGLTIAPQHASARLLRQDGRVLALDLVKILVSPGGPENVAIEPGDVLTVLPAVLTGAYVIGRVAKPGFYQLGPGAGVADAIRSAGGPQAGVELAQVHVYHADGTQETVDVQKAYVQNDPSLDKPLRGGDAVFVP